MKMFDQDTNQSLRCITLFLSVSEAEELRDSLNALIAGNAGRHEHVASDDFVKEITLAVYDPGDLSGFDEQSRAIILGD